MSDVYLMRNLSRPTLKNAARLNPEARCLYHYWILHDFEAVHQSNQAIRCSLLCVE